MHEEDVIGKLAAFTPTAVDRDAVLFAAGRASVRPSRVWKWATAVLLASQLVTLGLWLGPKKSEPALPPAPEARPAVPDEPALPPPDPYSLIALSHNPDPPSASADTPNAARSPLMAFSRNFQP